MLEVDIYRENTGDGVKVIVAWMDKVFNSSLKFDDGKALQSHSMVSPGL